MKKILLLAFVLLISASAFAQYSMTVNLQGGCVYPQPNTVYAVAVTIENTNTGAIFGPYYGSVPSMNWGTSADVFISIPAFSYVDTPKIYRVNIQATKLDVNNPYNPLCYSRHTTGTVYSTESFYLGAFASISLP